MPQRPYPRWQRRHEAVLVWLLENPTRKLKACAQATGYSRTHISRIVNSPDFRTRYEVALEAGHRDFSRRYFQRLVQGHS